MLNLSPFAQIALVLVFLLPVAAAGHAALDLRHDLKRQQQTVLDEAALLGACDPRLNAARPSVPEPSD